MKIDVAQSAPPPNVRAENSAALGSISSDDEMDPHWEPWVEILRRSGIARATAERVVQEAAGRASSGDAASSIADVLTARLQERGKGALLGTRSTIFIGPSGSGKTTTLAKLAVSLVQRGERPILVCADGESACGEDLLGRTADALGLPFETAFFSGQLSDLAARAGKTSTFLVDTPGRTPFSAEGLEGLGEIVRSLDEAEVILVLPATTDAMEIRSLADGFRPLGFDRVVLTKMDELSRPGRILDLAQVVPMPIAWVTYGREALGASSIAADPALISRILGTRGRVAAKA
jgi:flagellar biosynthesis protein FlhF